MVKTAPQSWAVEGRCHRPKLPKIPANRMIVICQAVARFRFFRCLSQSNPRSGGYHYSIRADFEPTARDLDLSSWSFVGCDHFIDLLGLLHTVVPCLHHSVAPSPHSAILTLWINRSSSIEHARGSSGSELF